MGVRPVLGCAAVGDKVRHVVHLQRIIALRSGPKLLELDAGANVQWVEYKSARVRFTPRGRALWE